jgi:hypothetical protein
MVARLRRKQGGRSSSTRTRGCGRGGGFRSSVMASSSQWHAGVKVNGKRTPGPGSHCRGLRCGGGKKRRLTIYPWLHGILYVERRRRRGAQKYWENGMATREVGAADGRWSARVRCCSGVSKAGRQNCEGICVRVAAPGLGREADLASR